ncbi:branched-chain amino acid transaminase [Nocardia sp. NPDC059195]|uniref:branched-chain amino acid transaminase n=1 Tax=Nocardia sp. NPDC059195 TaxID=3346765 RepID=UPI00367FF1A3
MGATVGAPPGVRIAYHDGEFVDAAKIRLTTNTQALHYGTGVFEGIRAYQQTGDGALAIFRLDDHLVRLAKSAAALRIELPHSPSELRSIVLELLSRNGSRANTYIRPLAYKLALEPGTSFGVRLRGVSAQLSIAALPMGAYIDTRGLNCKISSFVRVPSSAIPSDAKITGTYVNCALAVEEAQEAGCDDALLLDADGYLTEASTSNVFVVCGDGTVATPPATADLLPGITRASVIELMARELGVRVVERPVHVTELKDIREAFLTGTGVEVAPVTSIEHRTVGQGGIGAVTTRIREIYSEVVRGQRQDFGSWLTPVLSEPRPENSNS